MPNLLDRVVILRLSKSLPGTSRNVSTDSVEVDADKDMLHVSKDILKCEEFDAIAKMYRKLVANINKLAVKPSPMGAGHYPIPLPFVQRADALVLAAQAELAVLLPKMMAVYPQRVTESKAKLKALADDTDYPTAERFEAAFAISHSYPDFGTNRALETLAPEIYRRDAAAAERRTEATYAGIPVELAKELQELVDRMVERLGPATGKKKAKIFRDTLVTNLTEFIETYSIRDVTDNPDLNEIVTKAKSVLDGVDAETLRDRPRVKKYVRESMTAVASDLATFVTMRTRRGAGVPMAEPAPADPTPEPAAAAT